MNFLGGLSSLFSNPQTLGMGEFPSMLEKFQGQANMFPGFDQLNQGGMAMQGGKMPDLMNPAGAVTSPLTQASGMGRPAPLAHNPWDMGQMPDVTATPPSMDPNMALMGLAAMGRNKQPQQQMRAAPGGGLSQGQFRQYTPTPGARFLRR